MKGRTSSVDSIKTQETVIVKEDLSTPELIATEEVTQEEEDGQSKASKIRRHQGSKIMTYLRSLTPNCKMFCPWTDSPPIVCSRC